MVEHCLSELPETIGELKLLQSLNMQSCEKLESKLPAQPVKRSTHSTFHGFICVSRVTGIIRQIETATDAGHEVLSETRKYVTCCIVASVLTPHSYLRNSKHHRRTPESSNIEPVRLQVADRYDLELLDRTRNTI